MIEDKRQTKIKENKIRNTKLRR